MLYCYILSQRVVVMLCCYILKCSVVVMLCRYTAQCGRNAVPSYCAVAARCAVIPKRSVWSCNAVLLLYSNAVCMPREDDEEF